MRKRYRKREFKMIFVLYYLVNARQCVAMLTSGVRRRARTSPAAEALAIAVRVRPCHRQPLRARPAIRTAVSVPGPGPGLVAAVDEGSGHQEEEQILSRSRRRAPLPPDQTRDHWHEAHANMGNGPIRSPRPSPAARATALRHISAGIDAGRAGIVRVARSAAARHRG